MTKKNVFIFITVLFIFLICSMSLYAKITNLINDDFNDNALGWSYNIESEDVPNPNAVWHNTNTGSIIVAMNNAADPNGDTDWHTEVRYQGINLKAGVRYRVVAALGAWGMDSGRSVQVKVKFDRMAGPYEFEHPESPRDEDHEGEWPDSMRIFKNIPITPFGHWPLEDKAIMFDFIPTKDYYGLKLSFTFDGPLLKEVQVPLIIHILNVNLSAIGPDDVEVPVPDYLENGEQKKVSVNHLGYLPYSKKIAYFPAGFFGGRRARQFGLYDSGNNQVFSGETKYVLNNFMPQRSIEIGHIIDFSDYTTPGTDYYIKVFDLNGNEYVSQTFDISNDIYEGMADSALNYFYYNRSGIEINLGDEDPLLHRPAGHPDDSAWWKAIANYKVEGGWYDAGDFGKYTVPGAYAVWLLLNLYEQYGYEVNGLIPEDNVYENGINDLLDEAKYELDYLFKMQIPPEGLDGNGELAGAVFCKMHDDRWTSMPCMPYSLGSSDLNIWYQSKPRVLYKPTRTATLDFTAVMAQAWRIWRDLDPDTEGPDDVFAEKCRLAALAAYASLDEVGYSLWRSNKKKDNGGGGPYNDGDPRDEMYWALCELYLSTNDAALKQQYYDELVNLPVTTEGEFYGFKEMHVDYGPNGETYPAELPHSWQNVSGCGILSLYAAKDKIDNPEMLEQVKQAIISLSYTMYNKLISTPFGIPINQVSEIVWGSNQTVANRALLMSCAYEINADEKHLQGVSRTMDYLLGTNPLDYSYITGYGERSAKNPHHRVWAGQIDPRFASAPKGCLVGGPNPTQSDNFGEPGDIHGKDDLILKNHDPFSILGKIYKNEYNYLKAYVDSYDAYSTNEVTIYWNASLVCLAARAHNLNIYKNIDGLLENLVIPGIELTPEFDEGIFNYTATVDNEVDSFSLTPIASDDGTIIYVNGQLVESGEPSQIDLVVGDNIIRIYVENSDGEGVTYRINITREADGLLEDIEIPGIELTPEFDEDIFNYTATVDNEVDSFSLTPTAIDNGTLIYVNGVLVESGQPSQEINLNVGDNTITIYVESAGGDNVTYTINITREEADYILLTDQNTDIRNYRVNDELTFKILTGGGGIIQISSVVPWPSQVTVSINGGPFQPTPEQWGGPFNVPANTFVIFKVKAAVPTDIVLNWW